MKQDLPAKGKRKEKRFNLNTHAQTNGAERSWQITGAIFGLASGLVAIFFGSVFTIISWFAEPAATSSLLRKYGTAVFLLALPLFILGAHCLDLLEKKR